MQIERQPVIILVRPQMGENIGAAARAMLNFGLTDMRIVDPRDGWPNPQAGPAASGAPASRRTKAPDTSATPRSFRWPAPALTRSAECGQPPMYFEQLMSPSQSSTTST